jgi:hypothetical protein
MKHSHEIRMPMMVRDKVGNGKLLYARYRGEEIEIFGDDKRRIIARRFYVENKKGNLFVFESLRNGIYRLFRRDGGIDVLVAQGSMIDPLRPEVIALRG